MRVSFIVYGRVQGVGYRYFASQHGRIVQLSGWVRNAWDGTVEGEAEGEAHLLAALKDALARGPHSARVTRLDWWELDGGDPLPSPFTIR